MQKSLLVLFVYFFTCITNAKSNPIFGLSPSETAEINALCQNTAFNPENLGSHTQDLMLVKPITPENAFWLGACCGPIAYIIVNLNNEPSASTNKQIFAGATANAIAVGMVLSAAVYGTCGVNSGSTLNGCLLGCCLFSL